MATKTILLQDLIVSRSLLNVEIDDSVSVVISKLGEPKHHQVAIDGNPEWLLYGDLQLCFEAGKLWYFGINVPEFFSIEIIYESIVLHNNIGKRLDYETITKTLSKKGVGFINDPIASDENGLILITEREVHMSIASDDVLVRIVVSSYERDYYRRHKSNDNKNLR